MNKFISNILLQSNMLYSIPMYVKQLILYNISDRCQVIHFKQSSPGNTIHPLMCYLDNQWYSMFLFVHSESDNSIIISDVKQEDDLTCSTLIFHCNIMLVVMGFTPQFKMTTVLTSCLANVHFLDAGFLRMNGCSSSSVAEDLTF